MMIPLRNIRNFHIFDYETAILDIENSMLNKKETIHDNVLNKTELKIIIL